MKVRILAVVLLMAALALLIGGCKQKPQKQAAETQAPVQGKPALQEIYSGFKRVEEGDWAEWQVETGAESATVRYLFVGEEIINGEQAYGLEFSGELKGKKAAQQIWLSRETQDPVRFVAKLPEGIFCLDVSFYQPPASGAPQPETPEDYKPENIEPLQYTIGTFTTQSGKTIKVVKVFRPDKNQEVWVSSEVPFGLVKVIGEGKTLMELRDFGSGAEPEISREEMLNCRQFSIPSSPRGIPVS